MNVNPERSRCGGMEGKRVLRTVESSNPFLRKNGSVRTFRRVVCRKKSRGNRLLASTKGKKKSQDKVMLKCQRTNEEGEVIGHLGGKKKEEKKKGKGGEKGSTQVAYHPKHGESHADGASQPSTTR